VVDVVGLARALVLEPALSNLWTADQMPAPVFPRFPDAPEGGVTAWYTMRLTRLGADQDQTETSDARQALRDYEARDRARTDIWLRHFGSRT